MTPEPPPNTPTITYYLTQKPDGTLYYTCKTNGIGKLTPRNQQKISSLIVDLRLLHLNNGILPHPSN